MPAIDARLTLAFILLTIGFGCLAFSFFRHRKASSPGRKLLISFSIFLLFAALNLAKPFINAILGIQVHEASFYTIDAISWLAFAAIAIHMLDVVLWKGILTEDGELLIPNFIVYLTNFFILLLTFTLFLFLVLDKSVTILATSTGGLLIGIGYLAKNPLEAIFAGLSFTLAPMFKKGDRVSIYVEFIGEYIGTVKHMGWLHVSIQSKEGHIVHVQNMLIEKSVVTNFSQPFSKPCYSTQITLEYEVPIHQGYALIKQGLEELSDTIDRYSIRSENFGRFGITYLVRFWTSEKHNYDEVVHAINSAVYYKVQKHKELDFGYDKLGSMNASAITDKIHTTHQFTHTSLDVSFEERVAILRTVDIFESLDDSDIHELATHVQPRVFGPPEKIVRQGDSGDSMFILARGHARVYMKTLHEDATELAVHGQGKYFGEMALLTGQPRGAHVSALDDVLTLEVPKFALARILSNEPSLAGKIAASVARMQAQNEAIAAQKEDVRSDFEQHTLSESIRINVLHFFGILENNVE